MCEHKILFVDDEEELLESFTRWFSRRGFHVTTAHHPRLALAASASNTFDVVVVDMGLPEMNGIELVDQIKSLGDFPVIIVSGEDNPKLKEVAMEKGVYEVLLKPVSLRDIEAVVRAALENSSSNSESNDGK